jgi:hypothetical protein
METCRFKRPKMHRDVCYFVCYLLAGVVHRVDVNLRDRRLDAGLRGPRHGHVDVTHGRGRQRLAPLDKLRVRGIRLKSGRTPARLPNFGGKELVSRRTRGLGLVNSQMIQYVLSGFPSTLPQY